MDNCSFKEKAIVSIVLSIVLKNFRWQERFFWVCVCVCVCWGGGGWSLFRGKPL